MHDIFSPKVTVFLLVDICHLQRKYSYLETILRMTVFVST